MPLARSTLQRDHSQAKAFILSKTTLAIAPGAQEELSLRKPSRPLLASYAVKEAEETMAANPDNTRKQVNTALASTPVGGSHPTIDRDAPAGSENSLGAESVRDGRPTSNSNVVEAIDEVGPETPA